MKKALKILMVFLMVANSCFVVSAKENQDADAIILPPITVDLEAVANRILAGDDATFSTADLLASPDDDPVAFWNKRYTYEQLESLFDSLANNYPTFVKKYPIGHTWRERTLWCLELTAPNGKADKTPISVLANIHGGEQESGTTAAYLTWWLLANYGKDQDATQILDNYIVYSVPVINADGYAHTIKTGYSTRQNARPVDRNNNGTAFSDPYSDITGDGFIGQLYAGDNGTTPPTRNSSTLIGYESPDWDNNLKTGDDPQYSDIDMNRTFDHMWHLYEPDTGRGANTWTNAGPQAASEPEIVAVQNFLNHIRPVALISGHTGIQCVLWPWCYTPEPTADNEFFVKTGTAMAKAFGDTTVPVRGEKCTYYAMQSYNDYPTSSELIDWAYARLGTHAYTVEVYSNGGMGVDQWQNTLPAATWQYLGQVKNRNNRVIGDNVWCYTTGSQQVFGKIAPPDQYIMCEGFKNCFLVMAYSERPVTGFKATSATTLNKGKTLTIATTFAPETAANHKVVWTSSNTKVATVDNNGVVKGVASGTVVITGTSVDGSFVQKVTIRVM